MARFKFHVDQSFSVTYIAEGDTVNEAWDDLMSSAGTAECVDQIPEGITTALRDAGIEVEVDGDWVDA